MPRPNLTKRLYREPEPHISQAVIGISVCLCACGLILFIYLFILHHRPGSRKNESSYLVQLAFFVAFVLVRECCT